MAGWRALSSVLDRSAVGAALYADFVNRQFSFGGSGSFDNPAALPGWSFARALASYGRFSTGELRSFASGVARITDRGLLIEGARTNLILRSQEVDNASWTKARSTISADAIAAPDGSTAADKLVEDNTASNTHLTRQAVAGNSTLAYTLSVFAKAGERSILGLAINNNAFSIGVGQLFDISKGTVDSALDTGSPTSKQTSTIQHMGNGWYRCTVGGVLNSGGGAENIHSICYLNNGSSITYNGDNASGLYLWGAQLEQATGASSYVATTTASVARPADVASVSLAGLSMAYPCSIFAEYELTLLSGAVQILAQVDAGSDNDRMLVCASTASAGRLVVVDGGVDQADISVGTLTTRTIRRIAGRAETNSINVSVGGVSGTLDTSSTMPDAPTHLRFGSDQAGTGGAHAYLRRVAVLRGAITDGALNWLTA